MSDLRTVQRFLHDYGDRYLDLLDKVTKCCRSLQQKLGPDIINDVYTRKDSTHGPSEFKEPAKIASKVRQKGQPVISASFLELNDVIGLTVVLQYPDEIDSVIEQLRSSLRDQNIETEEPERHVNNNGYFATHVVCMAAIVKLKCEIQIKTILHNAWSAKMHDLTYKPMGMLDPRHQALMASIAASIESLEKQSSLIRGMIKAGWNVEDKARRLARGSLFDKVQYRQILEQAPQDRDAILRLDERIEAASDILATAPLSHPEVQGLWQGVEAVCQKPQTLRQGWIMAGRIASMHSAPELILAFIRYADAWLAVAPQQLTNGGINEREISAVPSMFYVIGDLDRAIDYADEILGSPIAAQLTEERRGRISYNRAAFLVEREYHAPTRHRPSRDSLKAEIDSVLAATTALGIADMRSAILDTQGLAKIAFAATKSEARAGIEDCTGARDPAEKSISDAYVELNLRLGWRRYFELEAEELSH